ncbi:MAG: tetratricopeptide repeat protein [Thermoleophilia bacterium]|nr:tetratricopeptide repeat protein [Thermoleophilia bacterium]
MARSAAKRRQRTNATVDGRRAGRRTPPPPRQPSPEDLMFFPRLRRQAKWMFVFLALVFGVGFVAFGVGSSLPGTGITDIFQAGGGTEEASIDDAREKIEKNPKDAAAHLELSRAYQRDERIEEAVAPLEQYTKLRPNDENALLELAGLHTSRADKLRDEAIAAQLEIQQASGLATFQAGQSSLSSFLQPGPLDQLVVNEANQRFSEAATGAGEAYRGAMRTYERAVKLKPRDANLQYLLAVSAEQAGEPKTALRAYRAFLRAAPDAAEAEFVRQKITQLEATAATDNPDKPARKKKRGR